MLDLSEVKDQWFRALLEKKNPLPIIAKKRRLFSLSEVEKRLDKLSSKDHETIRATYERMLEKWGERFQVKPSGVPTMEHLYDELPNFTEVLDEVRRRVALVSDTSDPLEISPMLLLGPPGIGKTHFAREIARLLGTGYGFISMSSLTAGWILGWASSQWNWARPGKVFETLVDGDYSNPVMVVDEIDKVRAEHAYDPLWALYSLLEYDTARVFVDEFAEVPIDASQAIWIATANDARTIPEPIQSRMYIFEIGYPDIESVRMIAQKLYREMITTYDWGRRFEDHLSEEVLLKLSWMVPRTLRRVLRDACGYAQLDGRWGIILDDIKDPSRRKNPIGF